MERLPKLALFDIDGTLFDSERLWAEALSLVFEELGNRQSATTLTHITYGLAWHDAYRALCKHFPETAGSLSVHELGARLCVAFDRLFTLNPPIISGSADLLRALHGAGVACGYVSGSPRATIELNLRRCGLDAYLDLSRSVPSDDMTRGKPFPDGYLLALERFGATCADAVAFEDSRVGSTAALTAGIAKTYVCPPPSAPEQRYPAGVLRVQSWADVFPELPRPPRRA